MQQQQTKTMDAEFVDVQTEKNYHRPAVINQQQHASYANLATALAAAQQKCKAATKESKNQHHNYKYASAENIITEAKDALADSNLALVPIEATIDGHDKEGVNRFELRRTFLLIHSSGETLPIRVAWPVVPGNGRPLDKAAAAADTLSLAYLLRDLLLMPRVDPDDDIQGRDDRTKGQSAAGKSQNPAPPQSNSAPKQPAKRDSNGKSWGEWYFNVLNKADTEMCDKELCSFGEFFRQVEFRVKEQLGKGIRELDRPHKEKFESICRDVKGWFEKAAAQTEREPGVEEPEVVEAD